MTQQTVRLLLNAADFPFSYAHVARSATENTDIGPRLPSFFAGSKANVDFGQPQMIFCENVLPIAKGLATANLASQSTQPLGAPVTDFDKLIPVSRGNGLFRIMSPALGKNYIIYATGRFVPTTSFVSSGAALTWADVDGRTFVCYSRTRIVEWDDTAGVFNTIALTYPAGLTIADVKGIGAAANYLLFFTDQAVHWSSPLNILEFADINQGAGNQTPTELVGDIWTIHPISGGAIIYASASAIGVRFTNNAAAPFVFKAIAGATGIQSGEPLHAAPNKSGGYHYSWGAGQLQKLTINSAENVFPALAEYLSSDILELWNPATKAVDKSYNIGVVKLNIVDGRYFCISRGPASSSASILFVYDMLHERWGKLRVDHVDVFARSDWVGAGQGGIMLLKANGDTVWVTVPLGQQYTGGDGTIIFGHFQERHDRMVTIQELVLDSAQALAPVGYPAVSLLGSETGAARSSVTAMSLEDSTSTYQRYTSRVTAQNFDIAIEGRFVLTTALAKVQKHGYR